MTAEMPSAVPSKSRSASSPTRSRSERIRLVEVRRARLTVAVGGDDRGQPALDEIPAELPRAEAVSTEERRAVHLQEPAALDQLVGERRPGEDDLRALWMGDYRPQAAVDRV